MEAGFLANTASPNVASEPSVAVQSPSRRCQCDGVSQTGHELARVFPPGLHLRGVDAHQPDRFTRPPDGRPDRAAQPGRQQPRPVRNLVERMRQIADRDGPPGAEKAQNALQALRADLGRLAVGVGVGFADGRVFAVETDRGRVRLQRRRGLAGSLCSERGNRRRI